MEQNSNKTPIVPEEGAEVEVTMQAETSVVENVVEPEVQNAEPTLEPETEQAVDSSQLSLEELFAHVEGQIEAEVLPKEQELRRLKSLINNVKYDPEDDSSLDDEVEDNGEERNPEIKDPKEELLTKFINLKTRYHELLAKKQEQEKQEREENYKRKLTLIERLEKCLEPTSADFFQLRNEFINIREEWKSIGLVPDGVRVELVNKYSALLDKFYEAHGLDTDERRHDLAENRKIKEELIEKAKELGEAKDVVKAFKRVQELQDEWKETGPVAEEFKDAMWKEFKDAFTLVNKRHDDYYKQRHEQEQANLEKKNKINEELENMLIKLPETREGWRQYERKMDKIRTLWKEAGRVPRSAVAEVTSRYRVAVDEFYLQRRTFMRELSDKITPKLERMRELVAEAESLKDSDEWKATTDRLQQLQKEWTEISKLGTRVAEAQRLWKRFRGACDVFFERKSEEHTSRMSGREENYDAKADIVDRLEELLNNTPENLDEKVKELQAEWSAVGRVPNEKKDELLDRYYSVLRALGVDYASGNRRNRKKQQGGGTQRKGRGGEARQQQAERRPRRVDMQKNLSELSTPELQDEISNIKRNISVLEDELRQYENNIGFFNASPDSPMILQIQGKIDGLRTQIEQYNERIQQVKEEMNAPATPKEEAPELNEEVPAPESEAETTATEE